MDSSKTIKSKATDRSVSRDGTKDIRAPVKKGGHGNHNWGSPKDYDIHEEASVE
ncbi:hypothetical protein BB560_006960, partial [Smittium megazygosporum]